MRVWFRVDASVAIGSGHLMRCATLAHRLARVGHDVRFLCRRGAGDLTDWLSAEGFAVHCLPTPDAGGASEVADAAACLEAIGRDRGDWLIVDHYRLGARWEWALAPAADRILVIDDIGRQHHCDLLLDQNYPNPVHALYDDRVPARCTRLLGPRYALLRPEFTLLRAASLRRKRERLDRLLVFMSGSDATNETAKALQGIGLVRHARWHVDVVVGAGNPHRREVAAACARLGNAELHVQTARMAELMCEADCAIGAAGSATWERCALGLPALVAILAENQVPVAEAVDDAGGHRLLGWYHALTADDYAAALAALDPAALAGLSAAAATICDGRGADRVTEHLLGNGSERD